MANTTYGATYATLLIQVSEEENPGNGEAGGGKSKDQAGKKSPSKSREWGDSRRVRQFAPLARAEAESHKEEEPHPS